MSVSERATASIRPMREADTRHHLSEQVRLAEMTWIEAEHKASCLEEGKTILRDGMVNNLLESEQASSATAADRIAKTSDTYKKYLRNMHDSRRTANEAKANWRALERDYWASVSMEASERAQMRMAR